MSAVNWLGSEYWHGEFGRCVIELDAPACCVSLGHKPPAPDE